MGGGGGGGGPGGGYRTIFCQLKTSCWLIFGNISHLHEYEYKRSVANSKEGGGRGGYTSLELLTLFFHFWLPKNLN